MTNCGYKGGVHLFEPWRKDSDVETVLTEDRLGASTDQAVRNISDGDRS